MSTKQSIQRQKQNILCLAYRQGCVFKRFKDCNDFLDMVKELGISRSTIDFKMNLIKLLDKFLRLRKWSLLLDFFKEYAENIKEVCNEWGKQFK